MGANENRRYPKNAKLDEDKCHCPFLAKRTPTTTANITQAYTQEDF